MSSQPVRVAIVNDYEVVVRGLARILEPYADRVVVVELEAGGTPDKPVDVALYDTFAAHHGATDAYRDILDAIGAGHLAVYCWHMDPTVVQSALGAGASGYLSKQLGGAELAAAIEKIAHGEVVVAGDYESGEIVEHPPGEWPGKTDGLSERESEIVALIAQGISNDDVAHRVFLSINTVKSHIRTAYRKMGVESRAQAILWAVDHGFRQAPQTRRSSGDDEL